MAFGPLALGLVVLIWLGLASIGWAIASLRFRPEASFVAWGAALLAGCAAAILPALVGLTNLAGLLLGMLLALVCSTAAAWQTMLRVTRAHGRPADARSRPPRLPRAKKP